jgi:hypothetical protein
VLQRHVSRERVLARSGELEIVIVSPGASREQVEGELRSILRPVLEDGRRISLGLATSRPGVGHRELLLESRTNARPLPG